MPILAAFVPLLSWLGAQLVALATWLFTKKGYLFAFLTGIIAAVGVVIKTLIDSINDLVAAIIPATGLDLVTAFMPDNAGACISAVISAHLACTGYKLAKQLIDYKVKIMAS